MKKETNDNVQMEFNPKNKRVCSEFYIFFGFNNQSETNLIFPWCHFKHK